MGEIYRALQSSPVLSVQAQNGIMVPSDSTAPPCKKRILSLKVRHNPYAETTPIWVVNIPMVAIFAFLVGANGGQTDSAFIVSPQWGLGTVGLFQVQTVSWLQ